MANTKKKRKTKHRGNAAGMVESRGRTGRRPTDVEKGKPQPKSAKASGPRPHRLDSPPTWKSSAVRAVLAAGMFFGVLVLFFKQPAPASAPIAVLMIAVYTPLGYFTDMWIHKRRVAKLKSAKDSGT